MDIYHKFYRVARRERLFSAPVNIVNDSRVLDLGAGTGIWVIDMAGCLSPYPPPPFRHSVTHLTPR